MSLASYGVLLVSNQIGIFHVDLGHVHRDVALARLSPHSPCRGMLGCVHNISRQEITREPL